MAQTKARAGPVVRATAAAVARMLEAGELGEPLPPERVLAGWLDVNRLTLRWAVDRLVAAGRLRREQGRGAFAAARPRVLAAERIAQRDDALVLAIGEAAGAAGGWPWRVWLELVRWAQGVGRQPVVSSAGDLAARGPACSPVIVLGDRVDGGAAEALAESGGAVVVVGRTASRVVWNAIDVEWGAALDRALDDVRVGGSDRVLVLCDRAGRALDAQRWYEALVSKLAQRGVLAGRIDVIAGGCNESGAYLATRRHLRETGREPTVLIADEDLAAAGAWRAIERRGLDPGRLRTVARGGTRVAQYVSPRLSTLTPPIRAIAQYAVECIESPDAPRALRAFEATYTRRESSGRR